MLRKFRTSRKMTQKQFADRIGVPRTTYQAWEYGTSKPTKENQESIDKTIKLIKSYEIAEAYYSALSRYENKPSFFSKRKLLKLLVFVILVFILTVLY